MKIMKFFFAIVWLLSFSSTIETHAQSTAGKVEMKFINTRTVSYSVEISVKNLSQFDDSLVYWDANGSTIRIPYTEKTIMPDSTCILKYRYEEDFIADGNYNHLFLFTYNHQEDSLNLFTNIRVSSVLNRPNYETPQFLSPLVYRHPKQNLIFNLFKNQPVYQVIDTLSYGYVIENTLENSFDSEAGIISIQAEDSNFPDHFDLFAKTYLHQIQISSQPLAVSLISDSTLPGYFKFDQQMEDPGGFLWYSPTHQPSENFTFQYIDSTADSIAVQAYSPLFNLGSAVQTITSQHNDTFNIQVSFPLTHAAKQSFPLPINFEIIPYTQGILKPRLVSVAVGEKTTDGILETNSVHNAMSIYPNPTSGIVSIIGVSEIKNVKLINTLGIQYEPAMIDAQHINLSDLPVGLYYISIETTKGISVHKILLQYKN